MKNEDLGLVPLSNFGIIQPGEIYRCAQPLYDYQYKWIANVLKIKIIINLRDDNKRDEKFAQTYIGTDQYMEIMNIPVKDHHEPTLIQCEIFIETVRNRGNFPMLIHCQHGHGRTSTFCVLARIAMGWDVGAAIREEEKKFHYFFKHPVQKEFLIKNFSNYGEQHSITTS